MNRTMATTTPGLKAMVNKNRFVCHLLDKHKGRKRRGKKGKKKQFENLQEGGETGEINRTLLPGELYLINIYNGGRKIASHELESVDIVSTKCHVWNIACSIPLSHNH